MIALSFCRPIDDSRAYVSNPFGNWYEIREGVWNFHSSIDIVFQEGSIMHAPIQSVAWGIVTYAARVTAPGYTVFGNLLVVKTTLPDGQVVYCRYAHHENVQVKVGDVVHPGQYLANVSDAYGQYAPHLDFAISPTDVLARVPWDWPGADLDRVYQDYIDPCSFIRSHSQMPTDYTALDAAMNNVLAAAQDMQTAVKAFEQTTPPPPVVTKIVVVKANGTNIRSQPTTGATPLVSGGVAAGTELTVTETNVVANGFHWYQIAAGPYVGGYIAQEVTRPKA